MAGVPTYIAAMSQESTIALEPPAPTEPEVVAAPPTVAKSRAQIWAIAALIGIGVLVYLNSFKGIFIFDDHQFIDDPTLQQVWPPWPAMFGSKSITRPVVGLTLAINRAMSGGEVWSYHAFNLIFHLLAALTLFGITRRTLASERLRERFGPAALPLAFAVALIWMVHTLQTESVTYIIQRAESMMGLFYLLTLYCAMRAAASRHRLAWSVAAFTACALGMGCKQVMASVPLMVIAYDWIFGFDSLKAVLRKRWRLYAALASTWAIIAALLYAGRGYNKSAGFSLAWLTPWAYFKSQFGVIVYYLRLAVWPDPLCLDYHWQLAHSLSDILPYAVIVGGLFLATLYALYRRSPLGFLGLWFFAILAPTSSFVPIADLAVERRLYLSLAAIVTLIIIGAYLIGGWLQKRLTSLPSQRYSWEALTVFILVALLAAWYGSLTVRRNADYHNEIMMWRDVASKRPNNPRAFTNLGLWLALRGELDEAEANLAEALRINPNYVEALINMGKVKADQGKPDEAINYFREAAERRAGFAGINYNIGQVYAARGNWEKATEYYQQELQANPNNQDVHFKLAVVLEERRQFREAVTHYRAALALQSNWPEAMLRLAALLVAPDAPEVRDTGEAVRLAEKATRMTRGLSVLALDMLAEAYAADGRFDEAVQTAREAIERAKATDQATLSDQIQGRLQRYEQGKPAN